VVAATAAAVAAVEVAATAVAVAAESDAATKSPETFPYRYKAPVIRGLF
jgi:hypothetical protein